MDFYENRVRKHQNTTKMETATTTPLAKLNDEIDGIIVKIERQEKELNDASTEDRKRLEKSIEVLNARLDARSDTRDYLLRNPAPVPAPGKNAPSRPRRQCPPSIREHAKSPARCRVP